MYLLLWVFLRSGGFFYSALRSSSPWPVWIGAVPFILVNLAAVWAAARPGRLLGIVRPLMFLDLGLTAVGGLFSGVMWASPGDIVLPPYYLAAVGAVLTGLVISWRTYHDLPFPAWLMPVRGKWARRFAAGVAVLLLQPISPALLTPFIFAIPNSVADPGEAFALRLSAQICALTAPFYLAPLFQFLVTGKRRHAEWHPTPEEALSALRASHPEARNAFARLILRFELRLHQRLCDLGDPVNLAAAKTRDYLLEMWHTWPSARFDELTAEDLPLMCACAAERIPPPALRLEECDLWTPSALRQLPGGTQERMRHWLNDPYLFGWMVRTWSEPDHVIAAELREATVTVLAAIAVQLPPHAECLQPESGSCDK